MLVLSRKTEQWIQIGENVTVKILAIRGGVVKVGIEAPRSVRVVRGELTVDECAEDHEEFHVVACG